MGILISLALGSDFFVADMGTGNSFFLKLPKLVIVAFFQLVSLILIFCLLLFICLFFLLDNLFSFCKKWVISSFEPLFIIFQGVILFSILTTAVSVGNLGWLSMFGEIAPICVQWSSQKAKMLFVISIITKCFFIKDQLRIIG